MTLTLMRRRGAVAAAALATALFASTALAATEEDETTFFLRQQGCGSTAEAGRLSVDSGTDSANGCGTIGGIPLDEALHTLGAGARSRDFTTENGVPLTLDASRDVTGVIATRTWTGFVGGVGEVVLEVTLTGTHRKPDGKLATKALGGGTFRKAASPTAARVDVPISLDVPAELDGLEFTSLTLNLVTRGANVNAGAQSLNGTSKITLPTLVETEDAA